MLKTPQTPIRSTSSIPGSIGRSKALVEGAAQLRKLLTASGFTVVDKEPALSNKLVASFHPAPKDNILQPTDEKSKK